MAAERAAGRRARSAPPGHAPGRLRLALLALCAFGAVYLVALLGLQALARHAESSGEVYPYRSEDWLRYLLPSLWPADDRPLVLLTGPSSAREALVPAEFAAGFPGDRVFQGGLSLGSLADVMTSLAYIERVYGEAALPEVMVLGVSPRFLAEIPTERPFAAALDRYSRWYQAAVPGGDAFRLRRKSVLSGLLSQARFLTLKQGDRYRTALAWYAWRSISPDASDRLLHGRPFGAFFQSPVGRLILPPRVRQLGIHEYAQERISARKYVPEFQLPEAGLVRWLEDPGSWWAQVHRWDIGRDSVAVRKRVLELTAFARQHRMEVYVVSLPERSIGRTRYAPGFEQRYRAFLNAVFDPVPVLDLRSFLSDTEFHDVEHPRPEAARRVSARVIRFVAEVDSKPARPDRQPAGMRVAHASGSGDH